MSIDPEPAGGAPGANRLGELAAARGEPLAGGGNRPIQLTDPGVLCFVAEGSVDVFAARRRADGVPVDFKHLLRAGAGRLLFPAVEGLTGTVLVAKGLPGSGLCLMPLDALDAARCDEQVVAQVEAWVSEVSEAVTREFTYRPRIDRILSAEAGGAAGGGRAVAVGAPGRGVDDQRGCEPRVPGHGGGGSGQPRRGPGHPRKLGDLVQAGQGALRHHPGAPGAGPPDVRPGDLQRIGPERR